MAGSGRQRQSIRPKRIAGRHLAALLLVVAGALALPSAASAADEIDWGFRHQFRSYVYAGTGLPPIVTAAGATCDPNPDTVRGGCDPKAGITSGVFGWTAATASYSLPSGDGTITSFGQAIFSRPDHFFTLTLENPKYTIESGNQLTANARVKVESTFPSIPSSDGVMDVGNFPLTSVTETATDVTWVTGAGTSTQEFADSTGSLLAPGSALDPVTIVLPKNFTPPQPPDPDPDPTPTPQPDPPPKVTTQITPAAPKLAKLTGSIAGKPRKGKRKLTVTLSRAPAAGAASYPVNLYKGKRKVASGKLKGTKLSLTVRKRKGSYPKIKGSYTIKSTSLGAIELQIG